MYKLHIFWSYLLNHSIFFFSVEERKGRTEYHQHSRDEEPYCWCPTWCTVRRGGSQALVPEEYQVKGDTLLFKNNNSSAKHTSTKGSILLSSCYQALCCPTGMHRTMVMDDFSAPPEVADRWRDRETDVPVKALVGAIELR